MLSLPDRFGLEAAAVFGRRDEGPDHFGLDKVTVEVVELGEPELKTVCVRIATKVTKVFHRHKRFVEYSAIKRRVFDDFAKHAHARRTTNRKRTMVKTVY